MDHTIVTTEIDLDDTPVVTVDLDIMERNIRRFQAVCAEAGVKLRPHIKTHKIPAIAHKQLEAGAAGIACQKLGEAEVMQAAGIEDITLTYNVVGKAKLERLVRLAGRCDLKVVCDNRAVADGLSVAFQEAGTRLKVLVECDTGAGRNGAQSPLDAAELAAYVAGKPGLSFAGLMTYPITAHTAGFFAEAYKELDRRGLKAQIVSTGGTPALGLLRDVPGVTEHRAGTYVFNDRKCVESGVATWDDCAMRIRSTVVSRPAKNRAIIDAGSKTLSSDLLALDGHGRIVEYPGAKIAKLNEEHGVVLLEDGAPAPEVGEVVTIIPNHTCVVTNLHDRLVGVRGGKVETVWDVAARGLVR